MSNERIRVTAGEAVAILAPFVAKKFKEQMVSVLPIVAYLFSFQLLVLRLGIIQAASISAGLMAVISGLMFFMEGLRIGLMPLGEMLGADLPRKSPVWVVLIFAFVLGMATTLAEPAIGALQSVGASIDFTTAPVLHLLLNKYVSEMAMAVGVGVGLAVVLGVLRFMYGFSLKYCVFPLTALSAVLTVWAYSIPEMRAVIGLAWDCGAVTTGPVTVPLVLALGLGVSRVLSKSTDAGMSGFGIITLASLFPIVSVLVLGFVLYFSGEANAAGISGTVASITAVNPLVDAVKVAVQAIGPLVALLFAVQLILVRTRIKHLNEIMLGIFLTILGMAVFNLGLLSGLIPLGSQVGGNAPAAFSTLEISNQAYGPLFNETVGKVVMILFAFFLGYGATIAEPALSAMGDQVENITVGAFKKKLLIHTVAFGVGAGIATGVARMIFDLSLTHWLLIPYAVLLGVTWYSTEEMTNIGWDAAGVTTGPITVPLVIALGLGVGMNLPFSMDGFGILSLASVFPILSVLLMGLLVKERS
jgi:hypothetical protein